MAFILEAVTRPALYLNQSLELAWLLVSFSTATAISSVIWFQLIHICLVACDTPCQDIQIGEEVVMGKRREQPFWYVCRWMFWNEGWPCASTTQFGIESIQICITWSGSGGVVVTCVWAAWLYCITCLNYCISISFHLLAVDILDREILYILKKLRHYPLTFTLCTSLFSLNVYSVLQTE